MEEYASIIFRTLALYAVILTIFRVMGKREIGELSLLDLVVFMMIAEMAAIAIEKNDDPLIKSLVPMLLLVGVQYFLAFISLKSKRFRLLVDGKPSIIINKGKIDENEMRKQRYNFDDLLLQLREGGVSDIEDVDYAILETSGKLSIFKRGEKANLALTLIIDGAVQNENLNVIGKSKSWLYDQLTKKGYPDIDQISFCNYNQNKNKFYVDIKDEK
ncbi:DUF421 domain-containing protein [Mesobacillus maritimus]|uniref:DUF421 domain-containing protein n=1 Tax=Mesobacillus maritimus TaxID=1643336 RepID=A0ABS7K1Y0_9BACI|nr:DUF421 domain-containing protein [Mesobacillus maritimus]MBY0096251.1 DUF421 domain-containing protein [Mesobacillus maritimus]